MWNVDLPSTEYYSHNDGHDRIQTLINEVAAHKEVAIDTETTGLMKWRDIPLYWSMAWQGRRCTLHASIIPYFQQLFADTKKTWIFANAKYDMHMLANVGVRFDGIIHDTQVMHSLLYEDKPHRLKFMAQHLLGWTWADFQDQFGKITNTNSPEHIIRRAEAENMGLLIEYAANDAWGTFHCHQKMKEELGRAQTHSLFWNKPPYINTLLDLFEKVESPYTKVLWKMERKGAKVNRERLEAIRPQAEAELAEIEKEINRRVGFVFNPRSNKMKQEYFYQKCGLTPVKWTKGGKSGVRSPSVDAHALEILAEENDVAALLVKHSEVDKLLGTYAIGLHEWLDPNDRIHSGFNQDTVRTGRLSSSDPNLQNIPKPENDKWNIRGAFIPEPGNCYISADYEQLEMRLLAAAAGERDMISIFERNWDIHMGNASLMFNVPYEDIKAAQKIAKEVKAGKRPVEDLTDYVRKCVEYRGDAKNIGFGLNYGMGATKLARQLKCSKQEAEHKIATYKARYPAVTMFYQEAIEETMRTGYAFTILGRRRNVPEIASYRNDERALGERLAINTQIQGSAADVCKMAQIIIDKLQLDRWYGYEMVTQVHDEINGECPIENAEIVKKEIKEAMEHPFFEDLAVHLGVDINHGTNWAATK